jgi:hypothetical protein
MIKLAIGVSCGLVGFLAIACGAEAPGSEGGQSSSTPASPSLEEIDAHNATAELEAGLAYTLEVGYRHSIKYFNPGNGPLVVSEQAPMGEQLVLAGTGDNTPTGLFKRFRPGEAVPAELAAFEELGTFVPALDPAALPPDAPRLALPGESPASEDLVPKHATDSFAHFRDAHRMCITTLGAGATQFVASPVHCWANVGGFGSTDELATHSQILTGSFNGATNMTAIIDGTRLMTIGIASGEIRTLISASGSSTSGGRRTFRTQHHRYELDGPARHVGAAFITFPSAPATFLSSNQPIF